jgi:cytochrome P450
VNTFELGATIRFEELEVDPYPILGQLREREPVSWCESLGGWLITGRALAEEVLRDDRRFTVESAASMNLRILGEQMLNRDGDEHRRHREPFDPPLRFRPVRDRYAELVERLAEELIDTFVALGAVDLRASFARILPVRVMASVLGLSADDAAAVSGWYDDFGRALGNYENDPAIDRRARISNLALRRRVLADLKAPAAGSIVGRVVAEGVGGLDRDELVRNVGIILFGGIETTESSILNVLWALLASPEQLDQVQAKPELVENAVDEALRWEAPTQILDRWAVRETTLGSIPIRQGDWVNVMVGAVNRDPDLFPQPDRYDVHRANAGRHMAFGHGPHLCIGFNLARLETQIALRVLLARLSGLHFDSSPPEPPRGIAFRKPPRLYVRWDAGR